jgi:predicted acyl esterase
MSDQIILETWEHYVHASRKLVCVLYCGSAPLEADMDMVGPIELQLSATITAADTAWIVMLSDVAPDGSSTGITSGWLRATLREVDPAQSRPGAPVLPCRKPQAVPIGEPVDYRVPLVPNARRFLAGHRIQLMVTSDDQPKDVPALLDYRHPPVGTTTRNTIHAGSRLLVAMPATAAPS